MDGQKTVTIVHAMPGRIRVRLDRASRSPEGVQSLVDAISKVEGVRQVQANPVSGSILVHYDPEVLGIEGLYLAARAANLNVVQPQEAARPGWSVEPSLVAQSINSAFGRLDTTIADITGGKIDAKTIAPLGLVGLALRQIVVSGASLRNAPWYVLLWYSFGLFTRYNVGTGRRTGPRATISKAEEETL